MQADRVRRALLQGLRPVAVVALCILLLEGVFTLRTVSVEQLTVQKGLLDARAVDFSGGVYQMSGRWELYPHVLYTPEDFAAGRAGEAAEEDFAPSDSTCGTHRLLLLTEPNQYLTLCGFSLDYATSVFVNGRQEAAFGQVSPQAEGFVPRIGYMTIPLFSGPDGRVEILIQYSNYVHREGGDIPVLYLSTPQNIEEFKASNDLASLTLSGGLLVLGLYFLLSAVVRGKIYFLCPMFCCLLMALRDQNFFVIHLLPPDASWYMAYRTLILIVLLMPVSVLLMLKCQYARATRQWPLYLYLAVVAVACLLVCVLPTRDLVRVSTAVYYLSLPYLAYLVVGTALYYRRHRPGMADFLVLAGFALLLAGLTYEALWTGRSAEVTRYGTAGGGMLGFVLLNATAMNLQIQRQETELIRSRERSEMLEKMNRLNMDFLRKVTHELKTPLTVISGYAQLTEIQLKDDTYREETPANLQTIRREAQRLANMVTRLMEYSYGQNQDPRFERVQVAQLLESVRAIAAPLCARNGNAVQVTAGPCADVHGNFEMLLQIFLNLVINATRSTENGVITLSVSDTERKRQVVFRVADTGAGIPPEVLPHIFEQGYSASGSSGLGLPICREAVEAHGGEIWLERTGPEGTEFAFAIWKEDENG